MSSSTLLCHNNLIFFNHFTTSHAPSSSSSSSSSFTLHFAPINPKRCNKFVSKAKKKNKRNKSWWRRFFFEDDGNWLGLKEDDMVEIEEEQQRKEEEELSEDEKFEAWKQRAEAIVELREAQEDVRNQEYRMWEDWLLNQHDSASDSGSSWSDGLDYDDKNKNKEKEGRVKEEEDEEEDYVVMEKEEKGLVESVRSLIFGAVEQDDDDLLYEDRVFKYASTNSAKFLAVLIVIPWAMDFLVHDYVLMPFLDRYVKKVPLAAQMLDVRRSQKLEMIKELKTESGRFELETEIGKAPPLTDDEVWWELRRKALELREEWRLENRKAFANIWSDAIYGISLFILLYFNKSKVALLKFTGYKIINNISDTGKAFLIILITDIFLGYHSESGWQTLIEIIVEHYGLEVDQAAITIFVCLVPVVVDACVKLWPAPRPANDHCHRF
ncbi:proton extrusion protein PcxA isoform X2 [Arachis ipaensis]|uniref:proton extrusion protein PcxA isoform X2 n=1 Tax=Arachis ipaensis TaxID=130454 RepID=UPI0007AFA780|nr:proton extrusion protein PcxA isoform X2 [Arachis ipaensis]XP_025656286.1 proton extrusion protein PcxA isoform X2 [Arachis hypogaea]